MCTQTHSPERSGIFALVFGRPWSFHVQRVSGYRQIEATFLCHGKHVEDRMPTTQATFPLPHSRGGCFRSDAASFQVWGQVWGTPNSGGSPRLPGGNGLTWPEPPPQPAEPIAGLPCIFNICLATHKLTHAKRQELFLSHRQRPFKELDAKIDLSTSGTRMLFDTCWPDTCWPTGCYSDITRTNSIPENIQPNNSKFRTGSKQGPRQNSEVPSNSRKEYPQQPKFPRTFREPRNFPGISRRHPVEVTAQERLNLLAVKFANSQVRCGWRPSGSQDSHMNHWKKSIMCDTG